jgi:hypothetical protein
MNYGAVGPPGTKESLGSTDYSADVSGGARPARAIASLISVDGWRRQILETLFLVAIVTVLQHRFVDVASVPGLPNPYWIPVVLASCHYGMRGGLISSIAASIAYFLSLSPASAADDFYAYARMVAIQPAAWLATVLVIGGLRNLHTHQYAALADQLARSRRRACDFSDGLARAAAEINALERRVAMDMSSVAALSRSLGQIDMRDRRTAATSLGELFRVVTGVGAFTFYLNEGGEYIPVCAIEGHSPRSIRTTEKVPLTAIQRTPADHARRGFKDEGEESQSCATRFVVDVASSAESDPLAVIVCELLQKSQDRQIFQSRAEELGRMFATILGACPVSRSDQGP